MNDRLIIEQGTALVELARKAIESHVSGRRLSLEGYSDRSLLQDSGVFVSLLDERGELRGCIGNPFPERALALQTAESAIEAASMDPRFRPLGKEEVGHVTVEVTVLCPIEQVEDSPRVKIPSKIVPGKHGLLVDGPGSRGLLLPQVAVDEGFDSEEFLCQCCIKAGMLPDAWLTKGVKISRFEAQIFTETSPRGRVFERVLPHSK